METTVFGVVKDVAILIAAPFSNCGGLDVSASTPSRASLAAGLLGPGLHLSYCRLSLSTYAHPWRPLCGPPFGPESLNLQPRTLQQKRRRVNALDGTSGTACLSRVGQMQFAR
jgi:hypothetical protein